VTHHFTYGAQSCDMQLVLTLMNYMYMTVTLMSCTVTYSQQAAENIVVMLFS